MVDVLLGGDSIVFCCVYKNGKTQSDRHETHPIALRRQRNFGMQSIGKRRTKPPTRIFFL